MEKHTHPGHNLKTQPKISPPPTYAASPREPLLQSSAIAALPWTPALNLATPSVKNRHPLPSALAIKCEGFALTVALT
eukprot:1782381-Pleurochrysis_carterae.AAC.2